MLNVSTNSRQSIALRTEAADAVTDGDLIGGLGLVVGTLQLFSGQALFGEPVLHPALDGRQRRLWVL